MTSGRQGQAGERGEEEPRASCGQELGSRWTLSKLGAVSIQLKVNRQKAVMVGPCNPELGVNTLRLSLGQDPLYSTSCTGLRASSSGDYSVY